MTTPTDALRAWREAGGTAAKPETNPILRFQAQPTLKRAVAAKCAECMGCTPKALAEGFRKEIRDCSSKTCSLWTFRPYQGKAEVADAEDS